MRRSLVTGVALCVLALATLSATRANRAAPAQTPDALASPALVRSPRAFHIKPFVRGYIAVRIPLGKPQLAAVGHARFRDVFLPRVRVQLLNLADNSRGDAIATDLSGRFTLPAKAGRYRVCWEAKGLGSGCNENIISVGTVPLNLSTVRIQPKTSAGQTVVFGSVQLADGSSLRLLEPLADVNAFARVVLLDEKKTEKFEALVNNFGDYLIPNVPTKSHVYLAARAEKGETVQEILPQANLAGAAFHQIDLTFRNAPPRLDPLVLRHGSGDRVLAADPGEVLKIEAAANDPDGDPVNLRWLADTGSGTLSATTGKAVEWKLPPVEGQFSLTLIASDGRGGYTRRFMTVRADRRGVLFSGRVLTIEGLPIAKAEVAVNGKAVRTDAVGFFRLYASPEKRYVVNVHATGFSFLSRIVDAGSTGGVYRLRRASVLTADPTKPIDVQDKRSARDCPGPASLRFDAKTFPGGVKPVWQDGKGNVIAPPKDAAQPSLARFRRTDGCGPGARVRIPANALQDGSGNPPAGPVQISLSTVDLLSPDQMPGDYTVAVSGSDTQVMESYGAAVVEITAGGKKLNLRPGTTAEITIPVDPAQLAAGGALPPDIPVLYYDESQGVWRQELKATLQGTSYVAKVPHFSAINMDTLKTDQACVRVDASNPGIPGNFRLQIIVPRGTGLAPNLRDEPITNTLQKEHVLYNLPTNTNITLAPYDGATGIPYGTFVVNTGGKQNPTTPNLPFGPPYLACSTLVVLTPQALPQDPTGGEFLHGLTTFFATKLVETDIPIGGTISNQLDQATTNYYNQVDPAPGARGTLGAFKSHHLFSAGGPGCTNLALGETCAIYANSGDLGFGREMHCKKNGSDVACYVTNYGNIDSDDHLDVADAVSGTGKVATVAMEYAPIEGDPSALPVVKFFVYNAADNRVNAANLDGKGLRPVPQLCMVCHGGHYPGGPNTGVPGFGNADDVKLGSEFLAFDLHNYTFAAAPFDKTSQQAAFKTLNQQMVLGGNASDHTQLYVQEMYDGDHGVPATTQEELLVVDDPTALAADRWSAQPPKQEMYKHVIGNACRTCHATNPAPSLHFTNAKQVIDILGTVEAKVCSQHIMPHAKRTHDMFWQSTDRPDTPIIDPHQPGILQAFGDTYGTPGNSWQGNLCGVFTGGSGTPPSAFGDIKTQILTPICSGCHLGAAPPGNLNLQAANAYTNLVNVNACERPVMKRVQPGSSANSYFFRKVEGTHGALGGCNVAGCNPFASETGCGYQMPWTGAAVSKPPLTPAQLTQIQTWINTGAPN